MQSREFHGKTVGELAAWLAQFPPETRVGLEAADTYWTEARASGPWRVGPWDAERSDGPWTFWGTDDIDEFTTHRQEQAGDTSIGFNDLPLGIMFTR